MLKHFILALAIVFSAGFLPLSSAQATDGAAEVHPLLHQHREARQRRNNRNRRNRRNGRNHRPATATPELDPAASGSALALLLLGAAVMQGRRREEDEGPAAI